MYNLADRVKPSFISLLFIIFSLFIFPTTGISAPYPHLLQEQAIKRIDTFIDYFRKTGDRVSLLPQLRQAYTELVTSYNAFLRSDNSAAAALCLIKLGDIQRMQNRWNQAVDFYQQAYKLAKEVDHSALQAKALMGRARTEIYGLRDLGAAAAHIDEARRLSAKVEDKSYLFDALDYTAQIQVSRG
ncbi:MAG: tetratricopeptide repeat protein, partial [Deltaproteobacteria bacterium]|nr:tetratricopeptide repeat protein [Deltaproteobacteria bacterium]